MSAHNARIRELHAALDELVKPIATCSSAADPCEARAARLYSVAFHESGLSGRAAAERMRRDERSHRDYLRGSRSVPIDALLRLPKQARLAFLREFLQSEYEADEAQDLERGAA